MKRWKHVEKDFDYLKVAEEVYMAAECNSLTKELGYEAKGGTYRKHTIMGKTFDPFKADEYLKSFPISNL